ncbi:MAG: hypothetical protein HCA25_09795 [Dolichospermum sp. DET50]|nr:hypothetical protein [Dolichospermum sp. DET66]MBS3032563.1 hypothetical protein [Dolichospermum sp. DET67]MBS3037769.1 hypothetical protein [Dolichospermum sp. DET50]QSX69709.1 MAG: hypothetical protein EZY12_09020 [Dolichospermum sp. DET69]
MQITSIKAKDKLKFVVLCLNLFIIGLAIPTISTLFFLLLPLILKFFGYLRIPKYLLKSTSISISIVSLILFVVVNYYQVYSYGLDSEKGAGRFIIEIVTIILLFLMGVCLDFKKMPFFPSNIVSLNLSLFSGGIIWVFLSVAQYNRWNFSLIGIEIANRSVATFWKGDDLVNGPSLDIFSYLGLSLAGLLISRASFSPFIGKFRKSIFFIVILILVLMSGYSSISLGARTPIVVFLISVFATFIFTISLKKGFQISRWIMIFFLSSIGVILFLLRDVLIETILPLINSLLELGIGSRLASEGLETSRYETWLLVINQMFDFPWGGRAMIIRSSYAHNIWLDQMYDAGILAMLLLLTFHLVQIPILLRFFRLKLPKIIHVFVLCTLIAFLAAFLQAPVIQANSVYFAMSCFFFGSVARFTDEYKFNYNHIK